MSVQVYTVAEVAALVRVSEATVRAAIQSGALLAWSPPGENRARGLRVSAADLQAWWVAGGGGTLTGSGDGSGFPDGKGRG